MSNLAQKLMTTAQVWSNDDVQLTPNQVLTARVTQKSLFRIGLWPMTSTTEAEIGVGIGAVLAALLERWPAVSVYRLMAQVDESPTDYQWQIDDSQFGVDDWEVEGLDENAAIWGSFEAQSSQVVLTLSVENDARDDEELLEIKMAKDSINELIADLPAIAFQIMNWLDPQSTMLESPYDALTSVDEQLLRDFLKDYFHWELDYYLELWGQGTDNDSVLGDQSNLIEIANELNHNFGAWTLCQSITRCVLFDGTNWSKWLLPTVNETAAALSKYPIASIILATLLFRLGKKLEAYDILESNITLHPKDDLAWVFLGDSYRAGGDDLSAIDTYQRAIEADIATPEIYLKYANIIDSLLERQIELKHGTRRVSSAGRPFYERYIFTEPDVEHPGLRESSVAYEQVLEGDSSNIEALGHLTTGLLALEDEKGWDYFTKLVEHDKDGVAVASAIEQINEDDLSRVASILQAASEKTPNDFGIQSNLVRVYVALGEAKQAKVELEKISSQDVPAQLQPMLAKLRLSVDDPDFDSTLGEIHDVLDSSSQPSTDEIEFLEAAIEKEPFFSEGYILLARSYLSWDEEDDALEVLLDGQKTLPSDIDLLALLAKVLWDADESDLAYGYLDQGLEANNRNPTLLALMGRFLFDDGEDAEAKEYLRRAEMVDPLNSELADTRQHVANTLFRQSKKVD